MSQSDIYHMGSSASFTQQANLWQTHIHIQWIWENTASLFFIFVRSTVDFFLCFACTDSNLIKCRFPGNRGGKWVAADGYKKNINNIKSHLKRWRESWSFIMAGFLDVRIQTSEVTNEMFWCFTGLKIPHCQLRVIAATNSALFYSWIITNLSINSWLLLN